MTPARVLRFILLISISIYVKAQGWCGEWGHLKEYSRNKICCAKKVVNRFDDKNQELGCCANELYYLQHHDCVEGELVTISPLEHLHPSTTRTLKEKPICRIYRAMFVYRLHNITMTNSSDPMTTNSSGKKMTNGSDQKIWATVRVLNLRKRKQIAGTKWKTFRRIRINVPKSLSRKYIGKNKIFVFSDKTLLREKSLNLSLGHVITKDKFRIKRCITT